MIIWNTNDMYNGWVLWLLTKPYAYNCYFMFLVAGPPNSKDKELVWLEYLDFLREAWHLGYLLYVMIWFTKQDLASAFYYNDVDVIWKDNFMIYWRLHIKPYGNTCMLIFKKIMVDFLDVTFV